MRKIAINKMARRCLGNTKSGLNPHGRLGAAIEWLCCRYSERVVSCWWYRLLARRDPTRGGRAGLQSLLQGCLAAVALPHTLYLMAQGPGASGHAPHCATAEITGSGEVFEREMDTAISKGRH